MSHHSGSSGPSGPSGPSGSSGGGMESSHKGGEGTGSSSAHRIESVESSTNARAEGSKYNIQEVNSFSGSQEKSKYESTLSASPEAQKMDKKTSGTTDSTESAASTSAGAEGGARVISPKGLFETKAAETSKPSEKKTAETGKAAGPGKETGAGKDTEIKKETAPGKAVEVKKETESRKETETKKETEPKKETELKKETEPKKETGSLKETKSWKEIDEKTLEKQNAAMAEIQLKEFSREELDKTAEDNKHQFFRNGEGKTISYAEAHQEILTDVSGSLDKLKAQGREISDEQREAILKDVNDTLLKQQAESQSRAIGNHGITHIYGNYERLKDTPDEVLALGAEQLQERDKSSKATAEDIRLGMILSAVYHDEGYLSERANKGVNLGADDSLHGVDSAIAFENNHRNNLNGAVDGAVLNEMTQAMAEHNLLSQKNVDKLKATEESGTPQPARMEMLSRIDVEKNSDLDPNSSLIRSSLLISDKVALDADEKVPDVLRQEETAKMVAEYYLKDRMDLYNENEKETFSKEMRQRMQEAIDADTNLSDSQKEREKAAIEKDISIGSGEFDMPLSGAAVSRDAVKFSVVTDESGNRKIQADVKIEHRVNDRFYEEAYISEEVKTGKQEDVEPSPSAKKVRGAMKDLGVIPKEGEKQVSPDAGDTEDAPTLIQDGKDSFIVNTEGIQGLDNVNIKLQEVQPDNPKAEISEYEEVQEATAEKLSEAAQEYREAEINERIRESFKGKLDRGTVSTDDILDMCTSAYETSPEEVNTILSQLHEISLMNDSPEKTEATRKAAQQAWDTLEIKKAADTDEKLKKGGAGV